MIDVNSGFDLLNIKTAHPQREIFYLLLYKDRISGHLRYYLTVSSSAT